MAAREVRFGRSEPAQGPAPVLLCNCGSTDIVRALASALAYSFAVVDVRELPLGKRKNRRHAVRRAVRPVGALKRSRGREATAGPTLSYNWSTTRLLLLVTIAGCVDLRCVDLRSIDMHCLRLLTAPCGSGEGHGAAPKTLHCHHTQRCHYRLITLHASLTCHCRLPCCA
jgi:hypothetical protein